MLCLVLFLSLGSALKGTENPMQGWLEVEASAPLTQQVRVEISTESRLSSEARSLRQQEVVPKLIWAAHKNVDFGVGYEYNHQWDLTGKEEVNEHLGLVFATFKYRWGQWQIKSRQKFEAGTETDCEGHSETQGTFRQKTTFSYDIPGWPIKLAPYIADEWFYDLAGECDLKQNRLIGGVVWEATDNLEVTIYGMRIDSWNSLDISQMTPVFGTSLSIKY